MPVKKYLGSGRQKRNLGSMESRWDAAWEHGGPNELNEVYNRAGVVEAHRGHANGNKQI